MPEGIKGMNSRLRLPVVADTVRMGGAIKVRKVPSPFQPHSPKDNYQGEWGLERESGTTQLAAPV